MPQKRIQSLKGTLLLDGGRLGGSCFSRTVVLICRHDASGAFGLVLNRRDERSIAQGVPLPLPSFLSAEPLHLGGPVQPAALSFLHSDPAMLLSNVIDQVRLGHDVDDLVALGSAWLPSHRLRVFAGYAGWSPGQLDEEMRNEAWLTHPASIELIFDAEPDTLWRRILKRRPNWEERILADAPEDLGLN